MVKAEIRTKDGTHIIIDGSEDEIQRIIATISPGKKEKTSQERKKEIKNKTKISIPDMLYELKEEGFFDKPKNIVEIKHALAEKGFIYEITTLSAPLMREVRKRNLGRIKIDKKWGYVRR